MFDTPRAYLAARANGWSHAEALGTARAVKALGGLKAAAMQFSAGGAGAWGWGTNNYWPNTFRKLTDSWPERAGFSGGFNLDAFWANSTAQSCLSWIMRTYPEPRLVVMEGDGEDAEEVERHELSELIQRPNGDYTPQQLWDETLIDYWMLGRGNAYWRILSDRAGAPLELWPIPAGEMEPQWPLDGSAYISHYRRTVNGETVNYAPEEILHFKFGRDPQNYRKGWSPILAAAAEIDILNGGAVYRSAILDNHGMPSYALMPKDEEVAQQMVKAQTDELERLWKEKFTGINRGGLFIPNFAAQLDRAGYSPEELDIRRLMAWDADMVCALFGLNSMVLGLPSGEGHRTYANQADAREAAFESNVIPTQGRFAATLQLKLLPRYGNTRKRRRVAFDYSRVRVLQEDQDKLWKRLGDAVAGGWVMPNEARKRVSLKNLPELDEVKDQLPHNEARENYQKGIMTRNEARKMLKLPPVKDEPVPPPTGPASPGQPQNGAPVAVGSNGNGR